MSCSQRAIELDAIRNEPASVMMTLVMFRSFGWFRGKLVVSADLDETPTAMRLDDVL